MIFHSTSVFSKKVKKSHSPLFFFLCSKHCFSEKKIWYSLGNIFVATPHTFFSRKSSFHHIQPYLGIVTSFLYNIHCYICIFHVQSFLLKREKEKHPLFSSLVIHEGSQFPRPQRDKFLPTAPTKTHPSSTWTQTLWTTHRNTNWYTTTTTTTSSSSSHSPPSSITQPTTKRTFQTYLLPPSTTTKCLQWITNSSIISNSIHEYIIIIYHGNLIQYNQITIRISTTQYRFERAIGP